MEQESSMWESHLSMVHIIIHMLLSRQTTYCFSSLSYICRYDALSLIWRCSSAVIAFLSTSGFAPRAANSAPSVGSWALTLSLGTASSVVVPTGWQKKAMLYRGSESVSPFSSPPPGNTTRCTVDRRSPLVQ